MRTTKKVMNFIVFTALLALPGTLTMAGRLRAGWQFLPAFITGVIVTIIFLSLIWFGPKKN
jgi:uncharacterized membrane protein YgaE (UPF0421/DUF939 family)